MAPKLVLGIFRFQKGPWSRVCTEVWNILPEPKDLRQSLLSFVTEPSARWQELRIHCVSSLHLVLGAKGGTIQTPLSDNRKAGHQSETEAVISKPNADTFLFKYAPTYCSPFLNAFLSRNTPKYCAFIFFFLNPFFRGQHSQFCYFH